MKLNITDMITGIFIVKCVIRNLGQKGSDLEHKAGGKHPQCSNLSGNILHASKVVKHGQYNML